MPRLPNIVIKFNPRSNSKGFANETADLRIVVSWLSNCISEAVLGRELKLDIVDYKQRLNCEALVILIDDIAARIKNLQGFAGDLKKWNKTSELRFTFSRREGWFHSRA